MTNPHPERFLQRYGSDKLECRICGATGYPNDLHESSEYNRLKKSWMHTHLREHDPCPHCGRMLVRHASGKIRRHLRCPNRPKGE